MRIDGDRWIPSQKAGDAVIWCCLWCQCERVVERTVNIFNALTWWRHEMETFSALLALCAGDLPVIGEFLSQRPVARSFDVFFDLRLDKRLSKQSWGWWFETPSRPFIMTSQLADILQTTSWKSFSSMKLFRLLFHCMLFLWVQFTDHWFSQWLASFGSQWSTSSVARLCVLRPQWNTRVDVFLSISFVITR